MIHDESKLHPSLPFLCLRSGEKSDPSGGRIAWRCVFPGSDGQYKENSMTNPEQRHVMVIVTGIRWLPSVSDNSNAENSNYLELSYGELLPACPRLEERS
jgi:hypothetical protein